MKYFCAHIFLVIVFLSPMRGQTTLGTVLLDSEHNSDYYLFSPLVSKSTFLIDHCGKIANQWASDYFPGLACYLDAEGNLWRAGRYEGEFFGGGVGGIIEKRSWSDEILGSYIVSDEDHQQHHDFHVLENGNFLTINWSKVDSSTIINFGMEAESISTDFIWLPMIRELMPIDESSYDVIWEWKMIDHLVQNVNDQLPDYGEAIDFPRKFDINMMTEGGSRDRFHINSIDYNSHFDYIAINSPFSHEFYVIDHSTSTEEASGSTGGAQGMGGDIIFRWGNPSNYGAIGKQILFGQHDIQWIDHPEGKGNFTVFNNHEGDNSSEESEVLEIENLVNDDGGYNIADGMFLPESFVWSVSSEDGFDEYSTTMSGAQRLDNGNTLICVAETGHLFEYTQEKEVVWEYIAPFIGNMAAEQGSEAQNNKIFNVTSYPTDFSAFEDKEINLKEYIESNEEDSYCELINALQNDEATTYKVTNPFTNSFHVDPSNFEAYHLSLYNSSAVQVFEKNYRGAKAINTENLASGLYVLVIKSKHSTEIKKIIKL